MPKIKPPPRAATVTPYSDNRKTGPCSVTYASQASCPVTCPLLGNGCYAEYGPVRIIANRLDKGAVGLTPEQIACQEALLIDRLPAMNDLRLHGVGDCRTNKAAAILAAAAMRYERRGGGEVRAWTYTHSFYVVARESWAGVSVLASCHGVDEVEVAAAKGYAAAVIVEDYPDGDKAWHVKGNDGDWVYTPCPYQSRGIQCVKCRLCMDDQKLLRERRVIAFKAHGGGRNRVIKTLEVIS